MPPAAQPTRMPFAVAVAGPLVVRRSGIAYVVHAVLHEQGVGHLVVSALTPARSQIVLLRGSRVGTAVTGRSHIRIVYAPSVVPEAVNVDLRVPLAALRPNRPYRLVVDAVGADGAPTTSELVFRVGA